MKRQRVHVDAWLRRHCVAAHGACAAACARSNRSAVLVNLAADNSETQARVRSIPAGFAAYWLADRGRCAFEYRWAPDADSIRKHAVEVPALAAVGVLANAIRPYWPCNRQHAHCRLCLLRSPIPLREGLSKAWRARVAMRPGFIGRIRHEREVVRVAQRAHARNVSGSRPPRPRQSGRHTTFRSYPDRCPHAWSWTEIARTSRSGRNREQHRCVSERSNWPNRN